MTLNTGLRWELNPAPSGSKPLYSYTPVANPRQITLAAPGAPLYATRYDGSAPRLGAAYQVARNTTVRAGFGLFYDLGGGLMAQAAAGFPYFQAEEYHYGYAVSCARRHGCATSVYDAAADCFNLWRG